MIEKPERLPKGYIIEFRLGADELYNTLNQVREYKFYTERFMKAYTKRYKRP